MEKFNMPKEPKLLIFDIDSTLYTCPAYAHEQIDSQVRHYAELNGMTAEEARKKVADFRKKWASEHGGKKISLGNLFTHFGVSIETSIEWRKTLFEPADYLKKDERLIETLKKLKSRFLMTCVTNNPVEPARKTLDALGISEFFKTIIGLDTCMISKPSKTILDRAIAEAEKESGSEIAYENCVSIGDRFDIDLDLAIKLGMGGILVNGVEDLYAIEI
ncbi:MAG: HAD family hydrolase [Treponema sp.]|nr:HAD family hydrolase [Treponema sp.]